jgi:hypothetical protein
MSGSRRRALQYAVNEATDHVANGRPRSSGLDRATLTNARNCSPRTSGSRPLGLVARSNVAKPLALNRRTQW